MERAEILGVGTELLYGETLDTNTAEIARSLKPYALKVERTLRVADEVAPLAREVEEAFARARLVVLSGGLGPTPDDVTREAVALALGEPLELDEAVLGEIEAFFRARGRAMPEANRKQAMRIPSAPTGTSFRTTARPRRPKGVSKRRFASPTRFPSRVRAAGASPPSRALRPTRR